MGRKLLDVTPWMGLYKFFKSGVHSYAELGASIGGPEQTVRLHRSGLRGQRGRRSMKAAILSQTSVINFVEKDISEMWPKWDSRLRTCQRRTSLKSCMSGDRGSGPWIAGKSRY
ncbi:hypothetical protein Bca52824_048277 [Brassica carinata]|uniref:Uncharacterized protein n=1 Tax=Brassica carinata TaxID=52824 RepID=A0A8X7RIP3_BRACI|nr:hypothetical protein Bca52824_048277 [Brassica carinata]